MFLVARVIVEKIAAMIKYHEMNKFHLNNKTPKISKFEQNNKIPKMGIFFNYGPGFLMLLNNTFMLPPMDGICLKT